MKPYYQDNHIELYAKDCRQMTELADNSIQCVVTSPPYWGLRKYSGEQELIWGDKGGCEHNWVDHAEFHGAPVYKGKTRWQHADGDSPAKTPEIYETGVAGQERATHTNFCSLCGAWKGAYGLEPTPEMYVQHTIEILREIRRVLRRDGVVFWNIGDSYAGNREKATGSATATCGNTMKDVCAKFNKVSGYSKPKDLCLIPFRLAIAAQEDGWWVRSVIIWSKPNPMPESVIDRPTESHEYILMLTKSARYYWDQDAVRETPSEATLFRAQWANEERPSGKRGKGDGRGMVVDGSYVPPNGRNIRTVWEFPTQPYPEARFAVFPEKLPELCIKASTPEVGCCSKCGAPWERVLDKKPSAFNIRVRDAKAGRATPEEGYKATQEEINGYPGNHPDPGYRETISWQPTCKCNADKVPSLVLDPFAGAGTTLWVAKKLNRPAVGYEISGEYCQLALERNRQQVLI